MRRNLLIITSVIIWLAAAVGFAVTDNVRWGRQEADVVFTDGCKAGGQFYLIENGKDGGILYVTDGSGKVKELFLSTDRWEDSTLAQLDENSGQVYGVVTEPDETEESSGILYRVVRFGKNGKPDAQTPQLRLPYTGDLTGFQADESGFYLTLVTDGGEKAAVCFAEAGQLKELAESGDTDKSGKDEEDDAAEALELRSLGSSYSANGGLIAAADYENGEFLLCTENGSGSEHFTCSEQLRSAFVNRKLSAKQWLHLRRGRLLFYLQILGAGLVILIILWTVLRNRTHIVYTIALVEAILLAVSALGFWQMSEASRRADREENKRFAYYYLQTLTKELAGSAQAGTEETSFYDSEAGRSLREELASLVEKEEEEDAGFFSDICLVDAESHRILVSAGGGNGMRFEDVHASSTRTLLDRLASGSQKADMTAYVDGEARQVFGIPVSSEPGAAQFLVAVTGAAAAPQMSWMYGVYAALLFVAGSAVCLALLLWQNREMSRFTAAIQDVANGEDVKIQSSDSVKDIRLMWNSLREISKIVSNSNYSRYQVLKSSYRFMPKKMEKILGKDSILEVKSGDYVRLYGTIAVISSKEPPAMAQETVGTVNRFVTLVVSSNL